ncbi:MAG: putative toxin-antitoxin system toxin component, PIN family [Paludibacter sp.]|jgi:putative PIN family toxin of toxin-antitoxin system|nr:putative toxin-antitoxin system toxin component, PIN family [Paludibacter sp.]
MTKPFRIVIDTNLWVSFLLSKKFDFIDNLLNNNKVQLVFSHELLVELLEVTERPKLKKFFTAEDKKLIFNLIEHYADYIIVLSQVDICRDEKDNFLLSLIKDAAADFLITGDKDLLVIKSFEKTKILTIAEFQKFMS